MVELMTMCAFLAMTGPIAVTLVVLAVWPNHATPRWQPASYQPMQMLMAKQAEARARAADPASGALAAVPAQSPAVAA